ncbi:hypothetical protein EVAR_48046_1 [Eumeta japonica]|uniref:Uncharacterized protein n=1 Tax=Eumeta variegata TaxID=151549 RepID=A0A4C1XFJ7_EUMVA|nr:hypothetical protein EVAR_48046_1 [Eumeta japonica]
MPLCGAVTETKRTKHKPIAMTERDKSRYTEGSVIMWRSVGFAGAWIRSDGSVEPAGIRATFSQKLESG